MTDVSKLSTIVYIDYDALYWGSKNLFNCPPDIEQVINNVKEKAVLIDIKVFADFTCKELSLEQQRLNVFTNSVFNCSHQGKNLTDFFMLDHIYRDAHQRQDVQQSVIVSGDGHYRNAVVHLKMLMDKTVGVVAVKGTLSKRLRDTASWYQEIEVCTGENLQVVEAIFECLKEAEAKDHLPTFKRTLAILSERFMECQVKHELSRLIEEGLIEQKRIKSRAGRMIRALFPCWQLIARKYGLQWASLKKAASR